MAKRRERSTRPSAVVVFLVALASLPVAAQPNDGAGAPPAAPAGNVPANKASAGATAPTAAPSAALPFLGLRPLSKAGGNGDLAKLAEAQKKRAMLERALADASKLTVIGHSQLASVLKGSYLVKFFECAGVLPCLASLAAPLQKQGVTSVVSGDYYVDGGTYHFHVFKFSIPDATLQKEVRFELSSDDTGSAEAWLPKLEPLFAAELGRVEISINVADALCRMDGDICHFEADGKTLLLPPGDHQLEASKDGYTEDKQTVTVEVGKTQSVKLNLEVKAAEETELRVPQKTGRRSPSLIVVRTDSAPKIDGNLDDLSWGKSWIDPNFTQNFPDEGQPATEPTEVRILYDDDAIYVAVRCFDSHPDQIVSRLTRRDRDVQADKVSVDISSKNDRASAYHFQVSAAGGQVDGIRFNDTDLSTDWDAVWYSAVSRDAKGWTVEMAIPLVALRYEGETTSFGFQVRRYLQRRREVDEWSYVPRTAQGEVSYYGRLDNLTGLNAKRLLQILPYDSRSVTSTRNQDFAGTTTGGKLGADLKLGLTPALTLDATINPDFGTVEADQVILNLSTVEVSFPEKRPFFVEGLDIFSTPYQLFYSRRIGQTPSAPNISANLAKPLPTGQILGALKASGLLFGRTSIGVLDALTNRRDALVNRGIGTADQNVLIAPLTNYSVFRLRQEFGTNSSIGVLGTTVNAFEPSDAAAPATGDLCPAPTGGFTGVGGPVKGRCFSNAYAGGVDARIRSSDGTWGASGQFIGSVIERGPIRYIPDGTTIRPGNPGSGLTAEAGKYGGNWLFKGIYEADAPDLEVNDAGYMGSANMRMFWLSATRRSTVPWGPFLDRSIQLNARHVSLYNFDDPNERWIYAKTALTFSNFWQVNVFAGPYYLPWYDTRDVGDGTRSEKIGGLGKSYVYTADITTDQRKSAVATLSESIQPTLRGVQWTNELVFSLRTFSAFDLDLIADANVQWGDPRYITQTPNGDGTRTFYYGDLAARTVQATIRSTYTFSPKLSLQVYAQMFVARTRYTDKITAATAAGDKPLLKIDMFSPATLPDPSADPSRRVGAINLNAFLRWEFIPGSALWFAYTHSQDAKSYSMMEGEPRLRIDRFGGGPAVDVFLVKLSYLWEPLRSR